MVVGKGQIQCNPLAAAGAFKAGGGLFDNLVDIKGRNIKHCMAIVKVVQFD